MEKQKNNISKKQFICMIIGIIIGIVVVNVVFDGIGIGNNDTFDIQKQVTKSQSDIEKNISFGVYEGDAYINNGMHFSFKLPSKDWSFKNADEIMAVFEDNKPQKNEGGIVYVENDVELCYYDMIAFNNVNSTSLQFAFTAGKSDSYNASTTADLYLNNLKKSYLQSLDAEVSDFYDVNIADEKYRAIDCNYSNLGCVQTIAVKKTDIGYINVLLTRYDDLDSNTSQSYFDMIY